jgi:hypothetical protein
MKGMKPARKLVGALILACIVEMVELRTAPAWVSIVTAAAILAATIFLLLLARGVRKRQATDANR